jgi:hypothetical protein
MSPFVKEIGYPNLGLFSIERFSAPHFSGALYRDAPADEATFQPYIRNAPRAFNYCRHFP